MPQNTRRKCTSLVAVPDEVEHEVDALYSRLLEIAGISEVTSHIGSIRQPKKAASELLILDRVLPSPTLASVRSGMLTRLLGTINCMENAEIRIRQANIKAQKLWRALDPSVSPISQLPDDILILIFELGGARDVSEVLDVSYRDNSQGASLLEGLHAELPFPLTVSWVCANWRSLALERSSLWTLIQPSWCIGQVDVWISRSKMQPLHIDLVNSGDRQILGSLKADLLRAQRNRWRSISIHIGDPADADEGERDMEVFMRFLFGENHDDDAILMPKLQFLHISSRNPTSFRLHSSHPIFPQLEELWIHRASADNLDVFCSSIIRAHLDLSGLFTWNWLGIARSTNLERLTLRSPTGSPDQENELENDVPFTLPNLRHLCLDMTPNGIFSSFLTVLRAPGLQSLHINSRSRSRIAKKAIDDFAALHPSVTVLQLYGPLIDIARVISPEDSLSQPFPRLQQLTLAKLAYMYVDTEEMLVLRRFFTRRNELVQCGSHIRLNQLRLDRTIISHFKFVDNAVHTSANIAAAAEEFEEDGDWDEDLADETATDGVTEFEEDEDIEDDDGATGVVDPDWDENEGAIVELNSVNPIQSTSPAPQDGAIESSELHGGEEWILRHVDVLEAIDFDWRSENL